MEVELARNKNIYDDDLDLRNSSLSTSQLETPRNFKEFAESDFIEQMLPFL